MMPRRQVVLKNLGPVSAGWLAAVGVTKRADLIRLGAVAAFMRVKAAGHKPSLNLLWALAGAERGLAWSRLTEQDRQDLLLELDAASGSSLAAPPPKAEAPLKPAARPKPKAKPAAKVTARPAAKNKKTRKR